MIYNFGEAYLCKLYENIKYSTGGTDIQKIKKQSILKYWTIICTFTFY